MRGFAIASFLSSLLIAHGAAAQETDADWSGDYAQKAERRSGFVLGGSVGLATGTASGFPNQIDKLNEPAYEVDTRAGAAMSERVWIGGALRDWFTFGLGGMGLGLRGHGGAASGGAFIFHLETYPLFERGGIWRDLALFGDFGAGSIRITRGSRDAAEGGLMSVIGVGTSWEALRSRHFAIGPALEYVHMWSSSLSLHAALFELRGALYGG